MNNTAELIRRKLNGAKRWGAFCWDQARKSIGTAQAESWEAKAVVAHAEAILLIGDLAYHSKEQEQV